MSAEPLNEALLSTATPWCAPVQTIAEITSTNEELLSRGEAGAPTGTLLFAERQTAGRGQFRRPWASATGLGLWFSLLLRIEVNDRTIPMLSGFAAVALMETFGSLSVRDCGIKAPNDLLLGGKKVAGILVETRVGRDPFAVVGIGLNVNHTLTDFPPDLQAHATSLALADGSQYDRNKVASLLLIHLGKNERLMTEDPGALLARWNELLLLPRQHPTIA